MAKNMARARKIRALQADIDRRTVSITNHKTAITRSRAELKQIRKKGVAI